MVRQVTLRLCPPHFKTAPNLGCALWHHRNSPPGPPPPRRKRCFSPRAKTLLEVEVFYFPPLYIRSNKHALRLQRNFSIVGFPSLPFFPETQPLFTGRFPRFVFYREVFLSPKFPTHRHRDHPRSFILLLTFGVLTLSVRAPILIQSLPVPSVEGTHVHHGPKHRAFDFLSIERM